MLFVAIFSLIFSTNSLERIDMKVFVDNSISNAKSENEVDRLELINSHLAHYRKSQVLFLFQR